MPIPWNHLFAKKSPFDEYPELVDGKHLPLLKFAVWVMLLGSMLYLGLLLLSPSQQQWRILSSGSLIALAFTAQITLRVWGAMPTVRLLTLGTWVVATGISFIGEGVRTPILLTYPILLIFSGWLLGTRFCLSLFAASSVAVLAMAGVQHAGFIGPAKPVPPILVAVVHLIILAISTVMTLYLIRLYQKRYGEERRLNDELQSSLATLKLREGELRIAASAFETQEAIMITDAHGVIQRINHAFTKITGYVADEAVGRKPSLLNSGRHGPEFFRTLWETLGRTGEWQGEIWDRRRNGEVYPAWLTISAVKDDQGHVSHYVGAHFDITEQKQAQEEIRSLNQGLEQRVAQRTAELEKAKDAALAAGRAKSEFLASMSHEIRTPLNAILGFSQLIGTTSDLPQETTENAQEIMRAGHHLLALINEVLDLARIESNQLGLAFKPVAVASLLADCLGMIKPIADKHGIELINQVDTAASTLVSADYVRLRQVVINLLSNAIKYNRPQGRVTLSSQRTGHSVRVSVIDSGPGIPADKQHHLFTAFDRIGKETGTVEGTGIGLVISKRLIEAMGGTIGYESVEHQGSTFWVELPVNETEPLPASETAAVSPAPQEDPPPSARRVVLYVEDSPASLRLMEKVIAKWPDMELRGAPTAEIGVALALSEPPALILMDINLPGMNGYEALAQLKQHAMTAQVPVIALTANAMKSEQEKALAAGFSAFVTKPIELASLYDTLRRALDGSSA